MVAMAIRMCICSLACGPSIKLLRIGGKTIHIPPLQKTFDEGGGEQQAFTFKA